MSERTNTTTPVDDTTAEILDLEEYRRTWATPEEGAAHDARLGAEIERRACVCRAEARAATREMLRAWRVPATYLREPLDLELVPTELGSWADTFPESLRQGGGAILEGPVGVGKTTATVYLLSRLWLSGQVIEADTGRPLWKAPTGLFVAWDDLAAASATSHYFDVGEVSRAFLARAKRADLLVVDDWGSSDRGEAVISRTEAVVWHRWGQELPTVITTNTRGDQFARMYPRTHSRVTDCRARSAPGALWINGPDLRGAKG